MQARKYHRGDDVGHAYLSETAGGTERCCPQPALQQAAKHDFFQYRIEQDQLQQQQWVIGESAACCIRDEIEAEPEQYGHGMDKQKESVSA